MIPIDHAIPAGEEILKKRPYETCKPLERVYALLRTAHECIMDAHIHQYALQYFGEGKGPGISRVILIDDNPDKSVPEEVLRANERQKTHVVSVLI